MRNNQNTHLFFSLDPEFELAKNLVAHLGRELSPIKISTFADGEFFCQPLVSVRNKKVFIIQTLANPVNENIMKLLISIDAFKRAAVGEINVVLPYFAYSRQDRKTAGRTPITAKLVSDLISKAGASRLLLVELHSDQIQGFFNIPIDHLVTVYTIAEYIKKNIDIKNLVLVAPDFGASKKVRHLSELLNLPLAIIEKKRDFDNNPESLHVFGIVEGYDCLIIDDIIDTGGTIISTTNMLRKLGAKKIYICATHGLFSKNALDKFEKCHKEGLIEQIMVTNTINNKEKSFLKTIDISKFLAEIIQIYLDDQGSVSELYMKYCQIIADIKQK